MQYQQLVKVYEEVQKNPARLTKTQLVSSFIKDLNEDLIGDSVLLLQGRIYPEWDEREIGLSTQLVSKAISVASGHSQSDVQRSWTNNQDLGLAAFELMQNKKQSTLWSEPLTIQKVINNLRKAAVIEGEKSVDKKIQLVSELLISASPSEAQYIVRTVLQQLRIGLGDGTIRDAIAWSSCGAELVEGAATHEKGREHIDKWLSAVQNAYELANDFSVVAKTALFQGLEGLQEINLAPGRPVKAMLSQKVENIKEGFERVGNPCMCEEKIDGFRVQIHKTDKITIFTRRLENVTRQFPDVVEAVKQVKANNFILDAEVVGKKDNKYQAFQKISQRIKRKHHIEQTVKDFPVEVNVFDILYLNDESLVDNSYESRRSKLEEVVPIVNDVIKPVKSIIVSNDEDAQKIYEAALSDGHEGMMMKKLEATYQPGARVGYTVKIKPSMETLDVVIIGAEWGEGKRSEWLSSFILAVKKGDDFVEIGRMGTGLKEKPEEGFSFKEMTELLKEQITNKDGREVRVTPKIIIEVEYEEVQKSPTYSSGFALRFPRFVRLRDDKDIEEISTLNDLEELYLSQRGRNN
jgi:DNA ligase-1